MHCVFLIQAHLNNQQIEQQYLLIIAMLNFDFKVQIIFDEEAWQHWQTHKSLRKKSQTLTLYGAEQLMLKHTNNPIPTEQACGRLINPSEFDQIIAEAGFIS